MKKLLALMLPFIPLTVQAQIINTWEEENPAGAKGIVTSVEEDAITEHDFEADGILSEWSILLQEFESTTEAYKDLEEEIKTLRDAGPGQNGFRRWRDPAGVTYTLPQIIDENGIDLFLLTRDGITIYSAIDAPAYLQEIDDDVVRWVRFYAFSKRKYTKQLFGRYEGWEPRIKGYFRSYGVPEELAELCLIESGCTYRAVSSAEAVGMWQIMASTGRAYGMKIDASFDERLDPVSSTLTAAKILKTNFDRIGDWTLATAAYNCGPGRFLNNRNKGLTWDAVKMSLPKETQQYIPSLIAIHYVWTYRKELGF